MIKMSIILKIFGSLSILAGIFFVFMFSDMPGFQPGGFSKTAIILGIFFFLLGIYLLRL